MRFQWDDAKHAKTLRERGIGFDVAAEIFERHLHGWADTRRDYGEERFRAVGQTEGRMLHVVYTLRGDIIRIISVRPANRKEIKAWQLSQ